MAERVAQVRVQRAHAEFPSGPIAITKRKAEPGQLETWLHFEGAHDFHLRAPDDDKAWVGVYTYMEKIAKSMFYFGFQHEDAGVVERFIHQRDKFAFGPTLRKVEDDLLPCPAVGYQRRGGCVLVTAASRDAAPAPLIVAADRPWAVGTRRVLCRFFSPGSGGARSPRDGPQHRLGAVGLVRNRRAPAAA